MAKKKKSGEKRLKELRRGIEKRRREAQKEEDKALKKKIEKKASEREKILQLKIKAEKKASRGRRIKARVIRNIKRPIKTQISIGKAEARTIRKIKTAQAQKRVRQRFREPRPQMQLPETEFDQFLGMKKKNGKENEFRFF